jgi:ribosome maturation factor RimP
LVLLKKIEESLAEELKDGPHFVVSMLLSKSGNKLNILIDGDEGVGIDDCTRISRKLSSLIDENEAMLDGPLVLEVSSPGADQPLVMARQYPKHIGRELRISLHEGIQIEGELIESSEQDIVIKEEKGKGKKKEITEHRILFDEIKEARVKLSFKKK